MEMWVEDPIGVKVNDVVVIQLQESGLFKLSIMFYLLPLLFFIAFALLGEHMAHALGIDSEVPVIGFSLLGLGITFFWLHRGEKKIIHDNRLRPVIIRRSNKFSITPLSVQSEL